MQLVRYEQARNALAECQRIDEVKDIRDKAEAMAAYARQAKDQDLIQMATEIKVRAERKAGEMLRQSADSGERAANGDNRHTTKTSNDTTSKPTLTDLGITRDQSSRWQSLASMSDTHFETAVETAKQSAGEVTTAFMLREAKKHKPAGRPQTGPKADAIRAELKKLQSESQICMYARLAMKAIEARTDFSPEERQAMNDLRTAIDRSSISTLKVANQ
ncbi:hypothetical protein [Caballeronia sp. LZ001]|uniref:hypothetical protein n=1 Tax=Caballeronia sp. LZ001 TaxID=3038553 RepID=UPI00285C82E9|nr:hypothetical protein [Caballeronia sp. LZ001]MDR5801176.1 hypothetical protein [Caballeronia sp. LZ001]